MSQKQAAAPARLPLRMPGRTDVGLRRFVDEGKRIHAPGRASQVIPT